MDIENHHQLGRNSVGCEDWVEDEVGAGVVISRSIQDQKSIRIKNAHNSTNVLGRVKMVDFGSFWSKFGQKSPISTILIGGQIFNRSFI